VRFTLDSNVLVYAIDRDAGAKHALAANVIARAAHADCVLTLQSLAEFFNVVTRTKGGRKRALAPRLAASIVGDWRTVFPVHAADEFALVRAMAAVGRHGLSFWDDMLWAAARRAACWVILSEDFEDGRRIEGVRFVNPFRQENDARLDRVLASAPRSP